ncbi:MAG: HEPN domain-containing protein [Verrucomicrobia bacterium]|nr:HEPN domain-containing protein [Verrucomicrobiota bacterium]
MPKTDEKNPRDWFKFADDDLELLDLALEHGTASSAALAKLLEALEKYLKGFLIDRGWRLVRTHDIEALLQLAVRYEPSLAEYIEIIEPLAEAYFENRYPGFDVEELSPAKLREIRERVLPLIERLKRL